MSRVIKYDALATADLFVNAVYEGEARSRLSGEPLSKLIPGASNQGGFRASGKGLDKKFVLLFTTLEDKTWPDRIDSNSGNLVYYGDNKKAKYELHKTPRGGNRILRYVFDLLHGSPPLREQIYPFFVFQKHPTPVSARSVLFRGLAVPGCADLSETDDLVAEWRTAHAESFQNYRATFTILDAPRISRAWINDLKNRKVPSPHAPSAWHEWVGTGKYRPLISSGPTDRQATELDGPSTSFQHSLDFKPSSQYDIGVGSDMTETGPEESFPLVEHQPHDAPDLQRDEDNLHWAGESKSEKLFDRILDEQLSSSPLSPSDSQIAQQSIPQQLDRKEIARKFESLRVWQRGDERAPHKPLLILYAIGRLLHGAQRLLPYSEVDEKLGNLLREFGPKRRAYHTQHPFWRLQNDGVWEIPEAYLISQTPSGDVTKRDLDVYEASGGFTEDIARQLQDDQDLALRIVQDILAAHFPPSIHEDILQAVELELPRVGTGHVKRDSDFLENVLKAYEYRCAVCGFDVRLRHQPVALEAAHIKWKQAGGPDSQTNGLALCVLHQRLFDRGAFILSRKMEIMVSDEANGSAGFQEWLMRFHGQQLKFPQRQSYYPDEEYVSWHVKQVFQGDFREF
ncbi:MAG: HNH endonuclease [Caldilineaceae bacterium]|nr:HNH endonuclease [Caldilineaceae bacterium]